MFSGKTTELMRRVRRAMIAGKSCIVLKPQMDTRFLVDYVRNHDGVSIPCDYLEDYMSTSQRHDLVAIDEGQFVPNLSEVCETLLQSSDVVVSGLNGDYKQQGFQPIIDIIPRADKIYHLSAICRCGKKAPFTASLVPMESSILVGGSESFRASCYDCL